MLTSFGTNVIKVSRMTTAVMKKGKTHPSISILGSKTRNSSLGENSLKENTVTVEEKEKCMQGKVSWMASAYSW